ncbi:hypothetical protein GCM10025734_73490 [Kitasatospora paranensis]|uniref:hypothetical protein n=1 Tax=Kitasatospora paranensis TaxID=258053 RepID=UPI0031EC7637
MSSPRLGIHRTSRPRRPAGKVSCVHAPALATAVIPPGNVAAGNTRGLTITKDSSTT